MRDSRGEPDNPEGRRGEPARGCECDPDDTKKKISEMQGDQPNGARSDGDDARHIER